MSDAVNLKHMRQLRRGPFAESASPEAIQARIEETLVAREAISAHLAWLHDLQEKRQTEVKDGTWPPKPKTYDEPTDTHWGDQAGAVL